MSLILILHPSATFTQRIRHDCSDQVIGTYTMTCVGYDEAFIRSLVRNVDAYIPYIKASKAGDTSEKAATKRRNVGPGRREQKTDGAVDENLRFSDSSDDGEAGPRLTGSELSPVRRSGRTRVKRVRTS